jgi:hypothetical protein
MFCCETICENLSNISKYSDRNIKKLGVDIGQAKASSALKEEGHAVLTCARK